MAKVRLVKGPFAGKVMESGMPSGTSRLLYAGTKPMSRRQKYEWEAENYRSPNPAMMMRPYPQVRCEYEIAMTYFNGQRVPCQHPDGSYFYIYVEGSKKEF